jgi:hypothetical protein
MAKISAISTPSLTFDEGAAPSTPAASDVILYAKTDGLLYSKDDAGTETLVSGGSGGAGSLTVVRKTANETVNNSATLQNDDHLLLAIGASEVWEFQFTLWYDAGVTPDIKFAITVPSGATLRWGNAPWVNTAGAAYGTGAESSSGGSRDFAGGTAPRITVIHGMIANSTNAGNLQLQWAQNTANASDTIVYANSTLKAWQLV